MKKHALLCLVGIVLVAIGAAFYSWPAGLIVAGGLILFDAYRKETEK